MIEVKGNIWDYKKADFICITTNRDVNRKMKQLWEEV